MRRYYEARHKLQPNSFKDVDKIDIPTGVAMFPNEKDLLVPREFVERCYNLRHRAEMPAGCHFPALEEPGHLVKDLRAFFRNYRRPGKKIEADSPR